MQRPVYSCASAAPAPPRPAPVRSGPPPFRCRLCHWQNRLQQVLPCLRPPPPLQSNHSFRALPGTKDRILSTIWSLTCQLSYPNLPPGKRPLKPLQHQPASATTKKQLQRAASASHSSQLPLQRVVELSELSRVVCHLHQRAIAIGVRLDYFSRHF